MDGDRTDVFSRGWRGQAPLREAVWVGGVPALVVLLAIFLLLGYSLTSAYISTGILQILVMIAWWRCSANVEQPMWTILVRAVVVLAAVSLFLTVFSPLFSLVGTLPGG